MPVTEADVLAYLRVNAIDGNAGTALLALPPRFQAAVLSEGNVLGTRNPSAALMGRIKSATRFA